MAMIGTQTVWTTERVALLKNRIDARPPGEAPAGLGVATGPKTTRDPISLLETRLSPGLKCFQSNPAVQTQPPGRHHRIVQTGSGL